MHYVRRVARPIVPGGNTYLALSGLSVKIGGSSKPRPLAWASLFRPVGAQAIAWANAYFAPLRLKPAKAASMPGP